MIHRIISLKDLIDNEIPIEFPNTVITINFDVQGVSALFRNKIFTCEKLIFENINNNKYQFKFYDCTFNCDVEFINCDLDEISFKNTKSIKSLGLKKGFFNNSNFILNSFNFTNDTEIEKPELNTIFSFTDIIVKRNFSFYNINHAQGRFGFIGNKICEEKKENRSCSFENTFFCNSFFNNNSFYSTTSFNKSNFNIDSSFFKNTFNKLEFKEVIFSKKFIFNQCDFLSTSSFENCKNLSNSHLEFIACKFEKYSLFDNSKINKFEIFHSKFLEKASFENFETNYFKIHQVTFAGAAYFDDLNKNNNSVIENWDRKTLRAIKRELVNTHNQIDYLRFKSYELEAFKKEKGKSWKDNTILKLNSYSSKNGLDWFRGLLFTTIIGFIFYLLYLCTYAIAMKNTIFFPCTIEDFSVGYLKFLNPFSFFKSPIEDTEIYFFPLFFFMFGKIFISFGIFQTVQAFRKFGVNGG